jgi:hypothetical protein
MPSGARSKIFLKLFHNPAAIVHRHHPDRNLKQILSLFKKVYAVVTHLPGIRT